ncbi:unnamed protein product [Dibothriocephalus latus]|uniref:E2F transcription factor CC-MB domain-containing protein n=1 Tax=Dibothriocephalus latus TaxID=60516 RepID=A0A3P7MCP7_DIBLA|nr:unnamed protein product [Dibothriocephalus latus]
MTRKQSTFYLTFRGGSAATNGPDIQARLDELQAEVEYLENLEKKVDEHRSKVLQSLQNVQEDLDNRKYSYVTHQDLMSVFHDRTLLVIRAPEGTNLDTPIPNNPLEQPAHSLFALKRSYKIHLKSPSTAVEVLLVNPDDNAEKARILPVGVSGFDLSGARRSGRSVDEHPGALNPLLPLSPPPLDRDFTYNLEDTEGLCDLFDVPTDQRYADRASPN